MMNPIEAVDAKEKLAQYIARRSKRVQQMAADWPYGMYFCTLRDEKFFVIGWSDETVEDVIILSTVVPWLDAELRQTALERAIDVSANAAYRGVVREVERRAA